MTIMLSIFMDLMALVGFVTTAFIVVVFGPGLLSHLRCALRGHRPEPSPFGRETRCERCGQEL